MSQQSLSTHEGERPPLAPYHIWIKFMTNGANDPTDFRGTITGVQRLTSTGGVEFYRITTGTSADAPRVLADKSTIYYANASAQGDIDGGEVLTGGIPDQLTMPTAPVAAKAYHIDVVVYDGGIPTNQVAAGRLVGVHLLYDRDQTFQ